MVASVRENRRYFFLLLLAYIVKNIFIWFVQVITWFFFVFFHFAKSGLQFVFFCNFVLLFEISCVLLRNH